MKKLLIKESNNARILQERIEELEKYRFETKFKEAVNGYVEYCLSTCTEIRACDYDSSIYYENQNTMILMDKGDMPIKLYDFDSGRLEDVIFLEDAPF